MGRRSGPGRRSWRKAPGPLELCCLFLCLQAAETLELKNVNQGPLKVLGNDIVALPCTFSGYGSSLNLRTVGIRWSRIIDNEEKEIYTFNGASGIHSVNRPGALMLEGEIKEGNAALHLPQIRFEEEGNYKCSVFVTPNKVEGTVSLEVSAKPKVLLSNYQVEVEIGSEKSVSCYMEAFYPQDITIVWKASLKEKEEVITKEICTGYPEKNPDGTFNVTSSLRLQPSIEDNQNVYTCIVGHRSLLSPLQLETTLTVKEPDTSQGMILGAICGTVFACFLGMGITYFIHRKYFRKVAPKITEITGNEGLVYLEKATLSCQITGFLPKVITVTFLLKIPGKETPKMLHRFPTHKKYIASEKDIEAQRLLQNGLDMYEPKESITFEEKNESHKDGTFSLTYSITIVPDIQEHNGAELCLNVEHRALPDPVWRTRLLKVVGVPPKLSDIVEPPKILHQESVALTCPINGFKPKPLTITWLRTIHSEEEEELVTYDLDKKKLKIFSEKYSHTPNENSFDDGTFNILSVLIFAPVVGVDNGANILCRIHHHATNKTDLKKLTLSIKAPPTLDVIQAVPEIPCTEDSLTLSCRIHSFFPKVLQVKWYKDDGEMSEMINNSDVISGPDGLCSCTSSITFTPRKQDLGKIFRCRVNHDSLTNHRGEMKPRESIWKLQNLICCPKPLKVICDPIVPELGKTFTLSCTVEDYYPPDCRVKWFKGFEPITNVALEDPWVFEATELYRRKSQITFTPTNDDHNVEFSVEVNHSNRVLREKYCMNLKDFPIVSDIAWDPLNAVYGEPLMLSCQVRGCDPKDVTVTWFEKDIRILKGIMTKVPTKDPPPKTNDPPPKSNDPPPKPTDPIMYCLEITPSALHYNKEFVFEVKHKNLPKAIKKQIYLPLKAESPVLSNITVTPEEPEVNKILRMMIDLSNFAPKDIQVKWYKDWMQLPREMVTCSEPHIGRNYLYVCRSTAEFRPKPADSGIQFRCEITHSTTKKVVERRFKLNLKGLSTNADKKNGKPSPEKVQFRGLSTNADKKNGKPSPEKVQFPETIPKPPKEATSSEIQCLSSNPRAGETVTLRYFIHGANSSDTSIFWTNGMFPIDEDCIENLDSEDGSGCTSTVTFQTDPEGKVCEIKCEVTKDDDTDEKVYILKLSCSLNKLTWNINKHEGTF